MPLRIVNEFKVHQRCGFGMVVTIHGVIIQDPLKAIGEGMYYKRKILKRHLKGCKCRKRPKAG